MTRRKEQLRQAEAYVDRLTNCPGLALPRYQGVGVGRPRSGGYNQCVGSIRSNEGFVVTGCAAVRCQVKVPVAGAEERVILGRRAVDQPSHVNGEPVAYAIGVPELASRIRPPGPVAWAACIALGHAGTPESLTMLVDLLTDSDWCYRQIALQALSAHALAKSAATQILACLSDPSPWVVRIACRTIGQLRLVEAHDRVRELLGCSDANVREMAVCALSSVWQPTDFNRVLELFLTDRSKAVRDNAAECLAVNVSEDNWRRLVAIWLQDSLPRHRVWACQSIARFGDAADRQRLLPLLDDPDGHVRKAAKRAYDAMLQ